MRLLFYKPYFTWPFSSGHDVHTFNMMRAMTALGVSVGLVTRRPSPPEALAGLDLGVCDVLENPDGVADARHTLSGLEERFRSYWGIDPRHVARVGRLARQFSADVVVVSGLDVLPLLGAVEGATRVWYAADEWVLHHLSQVKVGDRSTWGNVKDGLIKGAYERAYRARIDRAWVVSAPDESAMRWVAGIRHVDVLPNGVDATLYQPRPAATRPQSAVFWGRLDFGPNIQALQWFCRHVWPAVRRHHPAAEFTIIGFNPGAEAQALAGLPGVTLAPNLLDVRDPVSRHQIVVLPFVSGGGIKNKLLEAAAMGMPIVATRKSAQGLKGHPPLEVAGSPSEWVGAMSALWSDPARARALGDRARAWVIAEHSWEQVARVALERLRKAA
jgi:glycosyltransferase involved in cell wall biosynthesis